MAAVIAVDLGATSGRVILVRFDEGIDLTEVHRFDTAPEQGPDGLRLDIARLLEEIQEGIAWAVAMAPDGVRAVGIDSWAVDYGLVAGGRLVAAPFHYRDPRCDAGRERVQQLIDLPELYSRTGIQDLPFNTVNQLVDDLDHGRLEGVERMLLLPDLIGYLLTGRLVAEATNASTTGLLDPHTRQWDWELIDRLGLPRHLFPEVVPPGSIVGTIAVGPATGIPLVAVGTHDTASAVVGAPLQDEGDVFLSSGTWSLLGQELRDPILTPGARAANFTNEGGVDDRVRFLKNINGMWLLSESIRAWGEGRVQDLVDEAREVTDAPVFDATDPSLIAPGDMPERIRALAGDDPRLADRAVFTRSVLDSLALAYARTIDELVALTGQHPERLVIVGGGSANELLSQLAADRTRLTVTSGPMEATAIGNALVQARAVGLLNGSLEDLREVVRSSSEVTTWYPTPETTEPSVPEPETLTEPEALIQPETAPETLIQPEAAPEPEALTEPEAVPVSEPSGVEPSPAPLPHPEAELAALVGLSNEFGAKPAFTRAGGGNSSVKVDGVLWIKPSGVSMATLGAQDLVPLDVRTLVDALDAPDPDPSLGDPVHQLATRARLDDGPRRPSVEILFHALIEDAYVLHTHPLLINAVTCNTDGPALTRELFGDEVLWVDYVDPGLPLAREIARRRREHVKATGQRPPRITFLMNHGMIVSGDDVAEVAADCNRVLKVIQGAISRRSGITGLAKEFARAVGARAVAVDGSSIASDFPLTEAGARFIAQGPLIPDQIVYAGSFAVVLHDGDDVAEAVRRHEETHAQTPRIAVIPGAGIAAVGSSKKQAKTALEVYIDALTVARAATILGGIRTLDESERTFIETWEAEAYRQQVANH
ncbi:MAG: class II aldolase/adducin family protein [Arachnia propionica]|uniref:FGGY-family carbohydrate kinase n=1 Tax=Arachnia propionica TaxID=1750 RepID=UPI00270D8E10|nr:class II aldolase/adducin family protein [Arachnia propionica]